MIMVLLPLNLEGQQFVLAQKQGGMILSASKILDERFATAQLSLGGPHAACDERVHETLAHFGHGGKQTGSGGRSKSGCSHGFISNSLA
jgi:hypothetical protein